MARSLAKYGEYPLGPVEGDTNNRAWYNSSTMPGWIWKGDTSSDEVCGHMFTYGLIASLVPLTGVHTSCLSFYSCLFLFPICPNLPPFILVYS